MNVLKCDRCGKVEGKGGTIRAGRRVRPEFLRHWLDWFGDEEKMDLCDSCVASLRRWMKGDDTVSVEHFKEILRVLDERLPKRKRT